MCWTKTERQIFPGLCNFTEAKRRPAAKTDNSRDAATGGGGDAGNTAATKTMTHQAPTQQNGARYIAPSRREGGDERERRRGWRGESEGRERKRGKEAGRDSTGTMGR